jgi:hypothetical protein
VTVALHGGLRTTRAWPQQRLSSRRNGGASPSAR